MGAADIVPGVSGGTVALILGIYERLVTAISRVDRSLFSAIGQGRWADAAHHIDLKFLLCLGTGICLGILGLASLMHHLLEHQMERTFGLFFGLILASTVIVAKMVERWTLLQVGSALSGGLFAYWLTGLVALEASPTHLYLFLCGAIGICAMILPGISGAFILLILGMYRYVTGLLKGFLSGQGSLESFLMILTFATGCLVGLLSFSKILRVLLDRAHATTLALLGGFMLGSLRRIWPFKSEDAEGHWTNLWPEPTTATLEIVGLVILGIVLVWFLDRQGRRT